MLSRFTIQRVTFLSAVEQTALHNLVREEASAIYAEIISVQKESQSSGDSTGGELVVISDTPASDPPVPQPKKNSKQSSAEAVQSMLADIFHHTAGESEKDPQNEADSKIVNYLREKPISLDLASKKDNHNPLNGGNSTVCDIKFYHV